MGAVNSLFRARARRPRPRRLGLGLGGPADEDEEDYYDADAPVMGRGYCPLYDAASVGDWDRLVALCEGEGEEDGEGEEEADEAEATEGGDGSGRDDADGGEGGEGGGFSPFFVDAKGNTPLHVACRRDPPLRAVRALLGAHPPMACKATDSGWVPLHLACHCGCDPEVANALLDAMEQAEGEGEHGSSDDVERERNGDDGTTTAEDRLLPRDVRGRTPLHLACASSRDPRRRPDLVRLLLLRSADPRGAALARDRDRDRSSRPPDRRRGTGSSDRPAAAAARGPVVRDRSVGDDDASRPNGDAREGGAGSSLIVDWGEDVRRGDEDEDDGGGDAGVHSGSEASATRTRTAAAAGRTPLDLVEDDFREELEEALLPGFSVRDAVAACRGEASEGDASPLVSPNLDAMYECWAVLSVLVLAAGTPGTADRARKALGGGGATTTEEEGDATTTARRRRPRDDDESSPLLPAFARPCDAVVQDFPAIHRASQASCCPPRFRELAKKFLQGHVDKRSMGKFADLRSQWESRGNRGIG